MIALAANDSLLVGIIYRSPNSEAENSKHLCQLLTIASRHSSHLFIMGDFNFPSIDWASWSSISSDMTATLFPELLFDLCLYQ